MQAGLVFILSPERSGSTLLATMLGANPAVVAPPELFLLRYRDYDAWRRAKPDAFPSLAWLLAQLEDPATAGEIDERFRGMSIDALYTSMLSRLARNGPGRLLVDKTPAYGRAPEILRRAERFEPRYLWLVRHPLGVANSWVERRRSRRWSVAGRTAAAAAQRLVRSANPAASRIAAQLDARAARAGLLRWRTVHRNVERFVATVPAARVRRVFYEDLVAAPERSLAGISAWLGIPFAPAMLEPWKHLPEGLGRGTGDENIRRHDRIRADRAHSWRDRLDGGCLDPSTRELMGRLGLTE